jgi:hypothetical protein
MFDTSSLPKRRAVATISQLATLFDQHPKVTYDQAARAALPVKTFKAGRRVYAARHDLELLLGADAVAAVLDQDDATEHAIAS